ncbi:MAG: hypothetical protein RI897_161 [Verrucomicrobiota bacterium]
MHEGVVVGEERFGERVSAGLLHEVIEDTPAHVSVPGRLDVAGHLAYPGAIHPGGGHAIGLVDVAHEAVADGEVDFGVGGLDGVLGAVGIESVELSLVMFEVAVLVAESDLPVVFCGVAGGDEEVGLVGVERFDEGLGGIGGSVELGWMFSGLLFDHLVAVEFAEPEAFLDHVHGQFSACGDFTDRER